jgi:hypothetical protein
MNYRIDKNSAFYLFVSGVILLNIFSNPFSLPYQNVFFLITFFMLIIRYKKYQRSQLIFAALLLPIIIRYMFPYDISITNTVFFNSFIQMGVLFMILLLSDNDRSNIYNRLVLLLSFITGIGLFFHIFQLIGIPLIQPIKTIMLGERPLLVFLTHTYNIDRAGFVSFHRFSGIYSEPGYLGTIIAFILSIERFNLLKKQNIVLFLAGLFTLSGAFFGLSLAFYLITVMYIKRLKYWQIAFTAAMLVVTVSFTLFPETFGVFTERFEYRSDIGFADDRANIASFKQYISDVQSLNTKTLLYGEGRFADITEFGITLRHASWVHLFVRLGLILFVYFFILLLSTAFKQKSIFSVAFVLIFILSINQRPLIFHLINFFLLSCGIFHVNKQEQSEKPSVP